MHYQFVMHGVNFLNLSCYKLGTCLIVEENMILLFDSCKTCSFEITVSHKKIYCTLSLYCLQFHFAFTLLTWDIFNF